MRLFGVLNASEDSLADFSVTTSDTAAAERGAALVAAGASFLDLGAEGSTEAASSVTPDVEWARLEGPLAGALSCGVPVAVDTRHAEVAAKAIGRGASVLNAGDALQSEAMLRVAAECDAQVVLPFMAGPHFRQLRHVEGDPVVAMLGWFERELGRLQPWGLTERIAVDPGVGFGPPQWDWPARRTYQSAVYGRLGRLRELGAPLYVPLPWKQTPDRLALMDRALAHQPEYVRCHIPSQVLARHAAVSSGLPLPTDWISDANV